MIRLDLPYPPTINHYYGVRGKGRYIKPEGLEFRKIVAQAIEPKGMEKIEGNVAIFIQIYPPDNRKRDIDNVLKALLDALTHAGAWVDDSQIHDLHIIKGKPRKGHSGTTVFISEMNKPDMPR
jgi:crossover junction endodeoxyribonuclease RusA